MKDLTAILMGDPSAAQRRAPTERERVEPKVSTGYEQQRDRSARTNIFANPIGSERVFSTQQKARNAQKMFNANGFKASVIRNDDGTFTVRRVG